MLRALVIASFLGLVLSACGGDDDASSPPLEGTQWTLVEGIEAPADAVPTITFEGGNASGFAGCNRFNASYELDGNAIFFGPIATTRMACPEPQMQTETAYTTRLEEVESWSIEDGELSLRDAAGDELLRFAASGAGG